MSSVPTPGNQFDMEAPADTGVLNTGADEESLVDLALEQLEPVGAGMSVAKSFIDFSDRYGAVSPDRRANLGRYFDGLGRAYADIATALRTSQPPDAGCAAVQQHARQISTLFEGILTKEEALVLVGRLRALRSADRFHEEMERAGVEGEAGREYELVRLEKAASLVSELGRSLHA